MSKFGDHPTKIEPVGAAFSLRRANQRHTPNKTWPKEIKFKVVATWLAAGNLRVAAETHKVPFETVKDWRSQWWWEEFVADIRATEGLAVDNKLTKIVNMALDQLHDRLENGDVIVTRDGAQVRKPASLRDIQQAANTMITKQQLLRGNATARSEVQTATVQEQLAMLANEFAKMTNPKKEVIEAETVEIIREDVEEALEIIQEEDNAQVYTVSGGKDSEPISDETNSEQSELQAEAVQGVREDSLPGVSEEQPGVLPES